jgi:hypothetical protein
MKMKKWERSELGNTSKSCFHFLLGEVKQQLEHTMNNNIEEGWVFRESYCMSCYHPAKTTQYSITHPTLYNAIHDILSYPFNMAEDEGRDENYWKKIDENIGYGCLYEMFLSPDQYDDFEKNNYSAKMINKDADDCHIWWVSEDDQNYTKMNKFLEGLYKKCCDHVREKFYSERNLPEI